MPQGARSPSLGGDECVDKTVHPVYHLGVTGDATVAGTCWQPGLVSDWILHRVTLVALVLASGLAIALLPLTWAAYLLAASGIVLLVLLRPIVGLYLLIVAIPFGSLKEFSLGVMSVGGAEAVAALTVAAWLARMLARKEIKTVDAPLLVPLLLFVGVASFTMVEALSLQWSVKGLLLWLELLAVYLLVVNLVSLREAMVVTVAMLLAGSAQALMGFYQFFGRVGPEGFVLFDRFIRAYGTFEQPNPYGGYLAMILPLALSLFLGRWWRRDVRGLLIWGVAGTSLVLMASALLMSWSRGALLGFLAGAALVCLVGVWSRVFGERTSGTLVGLAGAALGALWLFGSRLSALAGAALAALAGLGAGLTAFVALRRRWVWLLGVLLLCLVAMFLALGGDRLLPTLVSQRFSDFLPYLQVPDVHGVHVTDENFAVVERLAHWQAALGMLEDHPLLGVGIGNYVPVYPAYAVPGWRDPLGHAHNYYLHIAAETGLLGLVAYLMLWSACFWHGWTTVRHLDGAEQGIALGILGVLGTFAVHSLFDNLYVHGMNMHLAIVLGLMFVLTRRRGEAVVQAH
jgi:putative inorganic carbon (HCO3(-)) transporter